MIFFARYEASQYGSPYIETEHLLLGLLREDRALVKRFLREVHSEEGIRAEIERHITRGERISTSVEVPLTLESKKILNLAAEEADRLGHRHIGTEHVLLGAWRVRLLARFSGQEVSEWQHFESKWQKSRSRVSMYSQNQAREPELRWKVSLLALNGIKRRNC